MANGDSADGNRRLVHRRCGRRPARGRQFVHVQLFGDYVASVDTDEKVVALTFDDGPHPQYTLDRARHSRSAQHQSDVLHDGAQRRAFPRQSRARCSRGATRSGNHSYSHPKLIFMWPARVREEIERTDALLRGIGASGADSFPPTARLEVHRSALRADSDGQAERDGRRRSGGVEASGRLR